MISVLVLSKERSTCEMLGRMLGPSFRVEHMSGLGAALVHTGLISSRDEGYGFVAVLGAPAYYGRFGFRRASTLGISNEYEADEAFMVIAFEVNALPPSGSLIKYAPEFEELSP